MERRRTPAGWLAITGLDEHGVGRPPTQPGLGIEIDEDAVAAASRRLVESGENWRTPIWHHDDGSLAEW